MRKDAGAFHRHSSCCTCPEGEEDYERLDRVLEQFEQFCTVTQSVRQGIDVQVTVKDEHGHTLLGSANFAE